MRQTILNFGKALMNKGMAWVDQKFQRWTTPRAGSSALETVNDLVRNKSELVLENALLRQ